MARNMNKLRNPAARRYLRQVRGPLVENTTHSGNTAHSVVTLGMYVGGALMTAGYSNLSLSCDKNGNLI